MKLWIVTYTHRHGADVWPRFADEAPSEIDEQLELGETWEGNDAGDWLEISGPFDVPVAPDNDKLIAAATNAMVHAQLLGSGQESQWSHAEIIEELGSALSDPALLPRFKFTPDSDLLGSCRSHLEDCVEQMEQCEKMLREDEDFMEVLTAARRYLNT